MRGQLRNIVAIVSGVVLGSIVNYALVIAGSFLIEPPAGVDMADMASIAAGIDLFTPVHFLFPFLAHALGTLAGALVTYTLATDFRALLTMLIGAIFLAGGISATVMIPAPLWFSVIDLVLAYLPMAWLAILLHRMPRAR